MLFDATFWSSFGGPVLTGIVTSGLVAGVVQVIFKARYDRQLESHKAQLSAENELERQRLAAESAIATERFRQRESLLAQKQALFLEEGYKQLSDAHFALKNLFAPFIPAGAPSEGERLKTFVETLWNAMNFFRQKRLFVNSENADKIDAILDKMNIHGYHPAFFIPRDARRTEQWKELSEAFQDVNGPVKEALRELESEFRKILTVA